MDGEFLKILNFPKMFETGYEFEMRSMHIDIVEIEVNSDSGDFAYRYFLSLFVQHACCDCKAVLFVSF